jgi:hypothetical protein
LGHASCPVDPEKDSMAQNDPKIKLADGQGNLLMVRFS